MNPAAAKPKESRRLRTGEAIYLIAAILLFILMFFQWYGTKVGREGGGNTLEAVTFFVKGGTAWQTLEVVPIFLMLAIAVAVGAAVLRLSGSDWKPAIPPGAAVCLLGGVAALLILIRMISPPGLGGEAGGFSYEATLELGIFLAFAAALGIAYGGWRAMRDEATSFGQIAKSLESPRRPAKPKSTPTAKSTGRAKSPRTKS